mgnify:FL=1
MPITFNSQGGFLNGTISSSDGNLFILTSGSAGQITVGNLKLSGSVVEELDSAGNIRVKKTFQSDGNIKEEKFNVSGQVIETKIKNPTTGFETIQSSSAVTNQIQFIQNTNNSSIVLSGSDPRVSIIRTSNSNGWARVVRGNRTFFQSASVKASTGLDADGNYYIAPTDAGSGISDAVLFENQTNFLMVSRSGDVVVKGGKLIAEEYVVSSSVTNLVTLAQSGSTKFGDTSDDTHQFTGYLFVSGNIELTNTGNLLKTQFVQMTNSSSAIDSFLTSSFRSAKYVLQVTSASNFQVSEMLVLHHNGTVSNTEYAQINSGLNLLDFTTGVVGDSVLVNAAGSFVSCSVRFDRTIIPT